MLQNNPVRHKIEVTGLKVWAHHGVFEFERQNGQEFVIDATVWVDLPANFGDDLALTVNYGELSMQLVENAKRNPVNLLETLAERLARAALGFGDGTLVRKAKITVHKPSAPIETEFSDVAVTVTLKAEKLGADV